MVKDINGKDVTLIPYFRRNNRVSDNTSDSKMSVWLEKDGYCVKGMFENDTLYDSLML